MKTYFPCSIFVQFANKKELDLRTPSAASLEIGIANEKGLITKRSITLDTLDPLVTGALHEGEITPEYKEDVPVYWANIPIAEELVRASHYQTLFDELKKSAETMA